MQWMGVFLEPSSCIFLTSWCCVFLSHFMVSCDGQCFCCRRCYYCFCSCCCPSGPLWCVHFVFVSRLSLASCVLSAASKVVGHPATRLRKGSVSDLPFHQRDSWEVHPLCYRPFSEASVRSHPSLHRFRGCSLAVSFAWSSADFL